MLQAVHSKSRLDTTPKVTKKSKPSRGSLIPQTLARGDSAVCQHERHRGTRASSQGPGLRLRSSPQKPRLCKVTSENEDRALAVKAGNVQSE